MRGNDLPGCSCCVGEDLVEWPVDRVWNPVGEGDELFCCRGEGAGDAFELGDLPSMEGFTGGLGGDDLADRRLPLGESSRQAVAQRAVSVRVVWSTSRLVLMVRRSWVCRLSGVIAISVTLIVSSRWLVGVRTLPRHERTNRGIASVSVRVDELAVVVGVALQQLVHVADFQGT